MNTKERSIQMRVWTYQVNHNCTCYICTARLLGIIKLLLHFVLHRHRYNIHMIMVFITECFCDVYFYTMHLKFLIVLLCIMLNNMHQLLNEELVFRNEEN